MKASRSSPRGCPSSSGMHDSFTVNGAHLGAASTLLPRFAVGLQAAKPKFIDKWAVMEESLARCLTSMVQKTAHRAHGTDPRRQAGTRRAAQARCRLPE